jgi:hypothetical protein
LEQGVPITQREKQMSYGVTITVEYKETNPTGTNSKINFYSFHVDTASGVKDLITQTATNANGINAQVKKVEVIKETPDWRTNPYRNLTDGEILELLLTK